MNAKKIGNTVGLDGGFTTQPGERDTMYRNAKVTTIAGLLAVLLSYGVFDSTAQAKETVTVGGKTTVTVFCGPGGEDKNRCRECGVPTAGTCCSKKAGSECTIKNVPAARPTATDRLRSGAAAPSPSGATTGPASSGPAAGAKNTQPAGKTAR